MSLCFCWEPFKSTVVGPETASHPANSCGTLWFTCPCCQKFLYYVGMLFTTIPQFPSGTCYQQPANLRQSIFFPKNQPIATRYNNPILEDIVPIWYKYTQAFFGDSCGIGFTAIKREKSVLTRWWRENQPANNSHCWWSLMLLLVRDENFEVQQVLKD